MTGTTGNRIVQELLLSRDGTDALIRLLERFLEGYEGEAEGVDQLRQQLDDALCLACWRRENVAIELEPVQVIDLLKVLVIMMEDGHWAEADAQALETACCQLSATAFAPGLIAVGTRGPHSRFDRLELQVKETSGRE